MTDAYVNEKTIFSMLKCQVRWVFHTFGKNKETCMFLGRTNLVIRENKILDVLPANSTPKFVSEKRRQISK